MEEEQLCTEFWIIPNQECVDEERRRDEAIQTLDITNMDTIILKPVIGENLDIFEQIVEQVNLSRGPTITNNMSSISSSISDNSKNKLNHWISKSYADRSSRSIQNRILERPGQIRSSVMKKRTNYVARSVASPSTNSLFASTMMPITTSTSIIGNNQQTNGIEHESNFMQFEILSRTEYQTSRYVSSFNENITQYPGIVNRRRNDDRDLIMNPMRELEHYLQGQGIYRNNMYFNVNPDVDEYLFDVDKEHENLTSNVICSICLTGPTIPKPRPRLDVTNDDNENNLTDNKFCHLSCADTHKFHSHCIKTWLKQNLTCPCCRAVPKKNNLISLISLASEKIKPVNSPIIYTNDPIIEQLRTNSSRGITRLREISRQATQYFNSHQQQGLSRLGVNSTNTTNQDIQSRDLEILGLNFQQSHPINFVSQEVDILPLEPIQSSHTNVIEANNNANNDEDEDEDYSHIDTFEL